MSRSAWGQGVKLWLPPLIFLAIAAVFLIVYFAEFADEAQVARTRLERRTQELEQIRSQRLRAESVLQQVQASEEGLADFYGRRLASESEALTRILAEIKDLCDRAGIPPSSFSYERETIEGQDLSRRTITFAVDGSYVQLRQLINLLELSDSFLILDQIALRGNDVEGAPLRISLKLSTLFTSSDALGNLDKEDRES
jgi:Tfp pilus assembly protein PilO